MERRLAAIVATDVVGYSSLVEKDEEGTIARLRVHRNELFDPLIAEHGGRLVKTTGDGMLIQFSSVVDAVRCAAAVQKALSDREAEQADDYRIRLRIGIHLGDIVIEDDDILGNGVNIAARLQSLAEPDSINVSEDVFRQVDGKVDLRFDDAGTHALKNIAQPVRIYRAVTSGNVDPRPNGARNRLLPGKPSIAIMPFDTFGGDKADSFFADGLTEDLITELSCFRELFVIARNSTFVYKGQAVRPEVVSRELGVRYVLEGSVQRAGQRVRINAQLVNALTGEHVWAKRYDRTLEDIFAVRDEVIEDIVGHLTGFHGEVAKAEKRLSRSRDTGSIDAYREYMRGLDLKHRFARNTNVQARRALEHAISLDPNFARAYTGLAWTWLFDVWWGWTETPKASLKEALRLATTSVQLDEFDAEVHWLLGEIHMILRKFDIVEAEYKRAFELNPNLADVHACWGLIASKLGRPNEGIEALQKAFKLNPNAPDWYRQFYGAVLYSAGRYSEAIKELRKTRLHTRMSRLYGAAALARLGQTDEARVELTAALKIDPGATISRIGQVEFYPDQDARTHFEDGMRRAGLPD